MIGRTMPRFNAPPPRSNPLNLVKEWGRRTGVNVIAGRNIRRRSDGLENFDDYFTDSGSSGSAEIDVTGSTDEKETSVSRQGKSASLPRTTSQASIIDVRSSRSLANLTSNSAVKHNSLSLLPSHDSAIQEEKTTEKSSPANSKTDRTPTSKAIEKRLQLDSPHENESNNEPDADDGFADITHNSSCITGKKQRKTLSSSSNNRSEKSNMNSSQKDKTGRAQKSDREKISFRKLVERKSFRIPVLDIQDEAEGMEKQSNGDLPPGESPALSRELHDTLTSINVTNAHEVQKQTNCTPVKLTKTQEKVQSVLGSSFWQRLRTSFNETAMSNANFSHPDKGNTPITSTPKVDRNSRDSLLVVKKGVTPKPYDRTSVVKRIMPTAVKRSSPRENDAISSRRKSVAIPSTLTSRRLYKLQPSEENNTKERSPTCRSPQRHQQSFHDMLPEDHLTTLHESSGIQTRGHLYANESSVSKKAVVKSKQKGVEEDDEEPIPGNYGIRSSLRSRLVISSSGDESDSGLNRRPFTRGVGVTRSMSDIRNRNEDVSESIQEGEGGGRSLRRHRAPQPFNNPDDRGGGDHPVYEGAIPQVNGTSNRETKLRGKNNERQREEVAKNDSVSNASKSHSLSTTRKLRTPSHRKNSGKSSVEKVGQNKVVSGKTHQNQENSLQPGTSDNEVLTAGSDIHLEEQNLENGDSPLLQRRKSIRATSIRSPSNVHNQSLRLRSGKSLNQERGMGDLSSVKSSIPVPRGDNSDSDEDIESEIIGPKGRARKHRRHQKGKTLPKRAKTVQSTSNALPTDVELAKPYSFRKDASEKKHKDSSPVRGKNISNGLQQLSVETTQHSTLNKQEGFKSSDNLAKTHAAVDTVKGKPGRKRKRKQAANARLKAKISRHRPSPAKDDSENRSLRRSSRQRVQPLAYWKLEQIRYRRDSTGLLSFDHIDPGLPNDLEFVHLKKRNKQGNRRKQQKQLLVSAAQPENIQERPSTTATVIDHLTGQPVEEEVVHSFHSPMWLNQNGTCATANDPFAISKIFDGASWASGHLRIAPYKAKPPHQLDSETVYFHIISGKVSARIHKATFTLEANQGFKVPPGNSYAIKNIQNNNAELLFFVQNN